jgi:hypothetical protein
VAHRLRRDSGLLLFSLSKTPVTSGWRGAN